jgi:hypothetical protein
MPVQQPSKKPKVGAPIKQSANTDPAGPELAELVVLAAMSRADTRSNSPGRQRKLAPNA